MCLTAEIEEAVISPGELGIFWLGQAGFLIKDHRDRTFVIDPYLTDCGYRIRGFKRVSPMPIRPEDFKPDYYLTTHLHFDHFDYDAIPIVAERSNARFFGPSSCTHQMHEMGIAPERCVTMELEVPYEIDPEFRITAVKADHGDMAPDAIGVILEAGGWCLYFSGDTALHTDWCEKIARTYHPDIAFLSINGAFGNMNAEEGAQAADLLGVQQAVPCHFWTFTEHGGNPQQFKDLLAQHPVCRPCCMRQGEMLVLKPACAEFASTMRRSVG